MSGIVFAALAGLLIQQADPHPATLLPYKPPTIRPFEAPADLGAQAAEGDADSDSHRRPLDAPVTVEAYVRSYEFSPSDLETAYDQGVTSAEIRADQSAGPLDGVWRLTDASGHMLFEIVLRDSDDGQPPEGAWRAESGDQTGLLIAGETPGRWTLGERVLTLHRGPDGWAGALTRGGHATPVRLVRPPA